jgi:hypothetical protein
MEYVLSWTVALISHHSTSHMRWKEWNLKFMTIPTCEPYLTGSLRRRTWPNAHNPLFKFVVRPLMRKAISWVCGLTLQPGTLLVWPGVDFVSFPLPSLQYVPPFQFFIVAVHFAVLSKVGNLSNDLLFTLHHVLLMVCCWCFVVCCCHLTTLMFYEHVFLRTEHTNFTATCTT